MLVNLFLNTDTFIYFLSHLCDPAPQVICGQGYILFMVGGPDVFCSLLSAGLTGNELISFSIFAADFL